MLDVMSPGIPNGLSQQLGGLADTLINSPMKLAQMRMEQQRLNNESMYRNLMAQAMLSRAGSYGEMVQGRNQHYGNQDTLGQGKLAQGAEGLAEKERHDKSNEGNSGMRAGAAQENAATNHQRMLDAEAGAGGKSDAAYQRMIATEATARANDEMKATTDITGQRPAGAPTFEQLLLKHTKQLQAQFPAGAPRQDAGQPAMPQAPAGQPPAAPSASDAAGAGANLSRGLDAQVTLQPSTNVPPRGDNQDPNLMAASTISGPPPQDATPGQNGAGGAKPAGPLHAIPLNGMQMAFGGGQPGAVPQTTQGSGGLPPPLSGPPHPPMGAGQMGQLPGAVAPNALSPDDQRMMVRAKGWAALPQFQSGPMSARYRAALQAAQGGDQGAISLLRNTDAEMARRAASMSGAPNAPPQNGVMPTAAPQAPTPGAIQPQLAPQP